MSAAQAFFKRVIQLSEKFPLARNYPGNLYPTGGYTVFVKQIIHHSFVINSD